MEDRPLPNIYQYREAKKYVQDVFACKASVRKGFSVRSWAQALGLKSHTHLHAVITKDRNCPLSLFSSLQKNLHLTPEQSHYLLLLINFENAKDQYSRFMFLDQIETLKKHHSFRMSEFADFEILSDPFWGLLLEMTERPDFVFDAAWIQDQSLIPKSVGEIERIIQVLLDKGLLFTDANTGRLKKKHANISNVHDLANLGSQKYHRNVSLLAAETVQRQPVEELDMNGYAFNIDRRHLPKMKKALRQFIKSFLVDFEASAGDGDATYQMNVQLFNLTRVK